MSRAPILLGAGGTGGHLFPAEALAAALRARGHSVVLVTDTRALAYADRFPGVEIIAIRSGTPTGKSVVGKGRAAIELLRGTFQALTLIGRMKPAAVVGFGGYPSLPLGAAAILRRAPLCLHEQNAVLGKVNLLLVRHAALVATSFADVRGIPAGVPTALTGNPVRAPIAALQAESYVPLDPSGEIRLLVFGGSQGAKIFSDCVPVALAMMPLHLRQRLRVTQQAREAEIAAVRATYEQAGIAADLRSFFDDMPAQLSKAHLVISRGGASTVAELTAAGRPSLIAPYPYHKDRHQLVNAMNLVNAGAGWVLPDGLMTPASLALKLSLLFGAPETLAAAAAAAKALYRPDAAGHLADAIEGMARRAGTNTSNSLLRVAL